MIDATAAMPYGIVLLASAIPAISVRFVAARYLDAARDVWLLGLAWVAACITAATVSLPLGLMAAAVLLRWRSWEQLPAIATWAGICATWAIVQSLPPHALEWLPIGWRLVTLWLLGFAFTQRWNGMEVKATTGSRVLLAGLLVLIWPFTSLWEWPVYALGFWLTSSWVAIGALLVAIAVKYPPLAIGMLAAALMIVLLFAIRSTRVLLIDRTPRGGSLDGLRMRWRTWKASVRVTFSTHWTIWLLGWGPPSATRVGRSLEHALALEAVRLSAEPGQDQPLATSPIHCEPLELACTYGLVAVAAMGLFAWQLAGRVVLGDAWSAAAVGGVVLAMATIPARAVPVGVVWLIVLAVVMR